MSAAVLTPFAPALEERERRGRVQAALRSGQRVASADLRDGEYFTQVHLGTLAALGQARRLKPTEYQYLLVLVAHSFRNCEWATSDLTDQTPPKLSDWARWLGGWSTQQVYNVRAALHQRGLIRYAGDDPARVCFNPEWEAWDPSVFQAQEARPGAGRKSAAGGPAKRPETKLPNLVGPTEGPDQITQFSSGKSGDLEPGAPDQITQFRSTHSQPAPLQAPEGAEEYGEGKSKKSNPANAGAVAAATRPARGATASAPVASPKPSASGTLPVPASWPERRADEPKADWYKACLFANEDNPAVALAYIAHLELRVPHTGKTLGRLGGTVKALRQRYGDSCYPWGTLLSAVLKAAAEDVAGDRLDYVDKLAHRLVLARSGSGAPRVAGGRATGNGRGGSAINASVRALLLSPQSATTTNREAKHE